MSVVETLIETRGPFALIQGPDGFRWELTTRTGARWHWHPRARQWTAEGCWSRTRHEASAGLEAALAPQAAGPSGAGEDLLSGPRARPAPSPDRARRPT
jgi:hypothetical protein